MNTATQRYDLLSPRPTTHWEPGRHERYLRDLLTRAGVIEMAGADTTQVAKMIGEASTRDLAEYENQTADWAERHNNQWGPMTHDQRVRVDHLEAWCENLLGDLYAAQYVVNPTPPAPHSVAASHDDKRANMGPEYRAAS